MNNGIKQLLLSFFGNCEMINKSEFRVHLGPDNAGYDALFELSNENITVLNLLSEVDKETVSTLSSKTVNYGRKLRYSIKDSKLSVTLLEPASIGSLEFLLDVIETIIVDFITKFPRKSWRVLGELRFNLFGSTISVLSSQYSRIIRTRWRGDIIAILRDDGWVTSNIGRDNPNLPLIALSNGEIFSIAPNFDENSFLPVNLTEFVNKIKELNALVGVKLIDLPRDESELLVKLSNVLSLIDSVKMARSDKGFSVIPLRLSEENLEKIKSLVDEIEDQVKLIRSMSTFDGVLRKRVALRLAIEYAKDILSSERGVIVSNVRKVSRLGAGKAIYIGREELKAISLGEKVLVSVIEEKGRKKIIIEPI